MLNQKEILSTIAMIDQQHLDIRTITMGISLLSCCDPDAKKACDKIYEKITRYAEKLVKTGEDIQHEFGIPIVNKRISVTPMALVDHGELTVQNGLGNVQHVDVHLRQLDAHGGDDAYLVLSDHGYNCVHTYLHSAA